LVVVLASSKVSLPFVSLIVYALGAKNGN